MTKRLVSVDEQYKFPTPLEARLDKKVKDYTDAEVLKDRARITPLETSVAKLNGFTSLSATDVLQTLPQGRYAQVYTDRPSAELGYPVNKQGMLIVQAWNGAGSHRMLQYFPLDETAMYTQVIYSNTARPWIKHEDASKLTGFTTLSATDVLQTLPPGRYSQVFVDRPTLALGYPVPKQGMLIVHAWNNPGTHKVLQYFPLDEDATYSQIVYSNTPRPWVKHENTTKLRADFEAAIQAVKDAGSTAKPPHTVPTQLRVHTEAGHPYTVPSGSVGTWDLNDTTDAAVGFQSIRMTTGGTGVALNLRATLPAPLDLSRADLQVWIKVDDWATNAGISIFLGTDSLNHYYQWSLNSPSEKVYLQGGLWRRFTIPTASYNRTGGSPDLKRLTHMEVRSQDNSTGTFTYHLGPLYTLPKSPKFPNGVVSFSFDDTLESLYTQAKPTMDKYGFAGTAYVNALIVGNSGRATMEQLRRMQDLSGWEIAGHSYTSEAHERRFPNLTEEELDTELGNLAAWLKDNGFHGTSLAYPGGSYNDMVTRVTLRHFKAGRTIAQAWETLPPGDPGALTTPVYVLSGTTTVDHMKAMVDQAWNEGYWLHLCFHDILPTPLQTTDYPTAEFDAICAYIAQKGIPVRTVADVLEDVL